MLQFRVFLSSPGDAAVERRRAEAVVSRLNGEFAGLARLETVRWETERYKAHATFQTQIPPAAECEIVVGILRWRLGVSLPGDFAERLPDGSPYPSGTAYELLTAIAKRKAGGDLPDVYVFRYTGGGPRPELGRDDVNETVRQWAALGGFIERWFRTAQGEWRAAFNSYEAEDEFEQQLEAELRKWLADKVAGGRVVPWPATKGSPFRGLSVFGAKHAPVFFGRARDIRRATDLWRDYAAKSTRFLLLVGASGAGKSSLARAGLIPRLTTPGVAPEVALWRVAVMRPGDSPDGPFVALAAALLQSTAGLPPEEEGRGPALPEIAEGDSKTPAELAAVLAHADAGAIRPVTNALDRIAARAAEAERHGRKVRCDLVLLVDQLDELFAPSLAPEVRERFAALLAALVASGPVWVIATLRADLYAPMLLVPALKGLKDVGASYDLAPPDAADLAEIVRAPAAAAALTFEADAGGERLDERLLREADRPDMLPLVQLALTRLWEAREMRGAETILPLAAFDRLGGVKGIVAEAGETALAGLGDTERAGLPPLIRKLAELSPGRTGAALTARAVPLAEAAPDAAGRALVDALVTARLLTLSGDAGAHPPPLQRGRGTTRSVVEGAAGAPNPADESLAEEQTQDGSAGRPLHRLRRSPSPALRAGEDAGGPAAPTLRLAHQRVLSDWPLAAKIVADSGAFYRIRDEVEAQRRRWEAGGRRGELLLARGLPLAEGREMATAYGKELPPETLAFVAASRRRANRAQALGWTAALVFGVVALGAGGAAKVALDQRAEAVAEKKEAEAQKRIAQRNFAAAKTTVDGLIFGVAQGLRDVAGMRVETIRTILDTVRRTVDQLLETAPDDPQLLNSRVAMLDDFATTYLVAGDQKDALAAATDELDVARKFAARDPGNAQAQRDLSVGLERMGDVKMRAGDQAWALAAYSQELDIRQKLAAQDPGNAQAQRDVSISLEKIGDVKLQTGDQAGALAAYSQDLDIRQKLAAQDPGNAEAQRDLSLSLEKIGDVKLQAADQAGALVAYSQDLDIRQKLAAQDPGNAKAQRDVLVSLVKIGDVKLREGDQAGALAADSRGLDIAKKLAAQDPGSAEAQRDISISLERIGDVKLQAGDQAGALVVYNQELDIAKKLAAQDPGNAQAQRDVFVSLTKVASVKVAALKPADALALFRDAETIAEQLAALDKGNAQAAAYLAFVRQQIAALTK